ncbi:MAG: nucleotidyltransferase domain-containing protein [Propionivibrio sp.]|jgi:predicted nucleotidyltransferase|nr:nucleotidyltransferase domain-containing protein [Propionivibrio sp.]
METGPIVEAVRRFLEAHGEGIACAYLFGSIARGMAGPASDLDIAVLYERDPPETLEGSGVGLGGELEVSVGLPVDLVVLNRAPVDLVHRVLRDGILVLERDRNARVRFEVRARNAYFDLKPHMDRYRRAGERPHG